MFVWSDGACAGIDAVYIDGQPKIGGWTASNRTDVTGRPVMMIEFTQAVDQGAEVSASGRGRVRNGRMIRNPGDVIADLMTYAGVSVPTLDAFSIETQILGIDLAGEIATEMTVQRAIRSVCESVGAMFSPRIRGTALIYPGGSPELVGSDPRIRADLGPEQIFDGQAEISGVINALSINFAMRDGKPGKVMDIECPESIRLYGRRAESIDAHWITDDGVMANISRRTLGFRARPALSVSFGGARADLRPGDYVRVDAARSPVPYATGVQQLVSANYDADGNSCSGEFELWSGDAPDVVVVRVSPILEDDVLPQAGVQRVGQTNQVTLTGQGGRPLSNARVLLDGSVVRYADGAGVVTFPLADTLPGVHTLEITVASVTGSADTIVPGVENDVGDQVIPGATGSGSFTFTIQVRF